MDATHPPTRPFVVAIEGCDGTGKTTLCAALAEALTANGTPTLSIKRPLPDSPARAMLDAALRSGSPLNTIAIAKALDDDARHSLWLACTAPPQAVVILDRHWLSAVVEQVVPVEAQRERHGEPDLWVICTADWRTVRDRLAQRATERCMTAAEIGGRLAAYEDAARQVVAPVMWVGSCGKAPAGSQINVIHAFNGNSRMGTVQEAARVIREEIELIKEIQP